MSKKTGLFQDFYHNKRVLITGHTGFKGSWLTIWLLSLGAKVAGYSLYYPSNPCHFTACALAKCIHSITGDVRDLRNLQRAFRTFKPEVVFHLAAQPIVRESFVDPKGTFDSNIGGTVNVLECIRTTNSVKVGVMITSDKCYRDEAKKKGYQETDVLGGDDPYSASKAGAEIVAHAYIKSFFQSQRSPRISTVRAGNVIGGGDWAADRIVPDCMRSFSRRQKVTVRNPRATRPWQHVLEPLSGYLWLGVNLYSRRKLQGEAFNFGPAKSVEHSVREVVENLARFWKGQWRLDQRKQFGKETHLLKLSCGKAARLLSWQPVLNFSETVRMTSSWYERYYQAKENMYAFSARQIQEYVKRARQESLLWTRRKR